MSFSTRSNVQSGTMFRLLIAAVLLCLLWEPIRPVRQLTAQVLYSTADAIAR